MKQIENYLRGIIVTGIFAIPFLAFVVAGSLFFPYITGKNFGFRMIVEVIFAAWFLLAYYNKEYRPKFSWIMAMASIFVVVVFLADSFGFNAYKSFWSNYERMEGFVGLIHVFAYFVVLGSVLTKDLWTKFLHTSVCASILMSFYGIIQLMGDAVISQGGSRLDGRFGNAAYFGGYLLFNIFLTAFLIVRRKEFDWLSYLYTAVIALQMYIMFATETRGSMLGLFGGIIVAALLFIFLDKKRPVLKWIAGGIIGFLIIFVFLVFQNKETDFVKSHAPLSRLASISLAETTVASRFMVWGMAIDGFKERPLLGWGQENFNVVFNKFYNPGMYAQEQWFDRAHDIFLDWLIAAGIFGLLFYLLLFLSGMALVWEAETGTEEKGLWAKIKHSWRKHVSGEEQNKILERSILTGLFVSYFIHNIFVFDNLFSYILFFSLLAFLHHNHTQKLPTLPTMHQKKQQIKIIDEEILPISYIGSVVVFVFCLVFYFVNIRPIEANTILIDAIQPRQQSGLPMQENLDLFKQVFSYNTFGNSEAREQLVQAAMRASGTEFPPALQKDIFSFANQQILLQLDETPNDARYETFAGMLFARYKMNPEALAHFQKAHELSPAKQTISNNLIMAYLNSGDNSSIQKALSLAKTSYESAPAFDEAAKMYALTLMRTGEVEQGQQVLFKQFGTDLIFDENLINVYAALGNYEKIIAIIDKQLTVKDDPQLRIRLAAAYLGANQRANAILEVQKIMVSNPEFKQQGEAYIQEIRAGRNP